MAETQSDDRAGKTVSGTGLSGKSRRSGIRCTDSIMLTERTSITVAGMLLAIISLFIVTMQTQAATEIPVAADPELSVTEKIDTIWVLMCCILVFMMQAGFALLESGMVRSKNAINVMMKNYVDLCVVIIAYWLLGYGLMFGNKFQNIIGIDHFLFQPTAGTETNFLVFQMMFAATAATIVSGALAERIRFTGYIVSSLFICVLIYPVYGSWAWSGIHANSGWLYNMGYIDFAGASVVHATGGWVALAGILVIGPRLGRFGADGTVRPILGHNLSFVALSGFLLWFGWFGFNAGSGLGVDSGTATIILNTLIGGASGLIGGILTMILTRSPVLLTASVMSSIGGLVSITAGCNTMEPIWACVVGAISGPITIFGNQLLERLELDDAVGAVPVHAFCGFWGVLAAGIFYDGNMFSFSLITVQLIGATTNMIWCLATGLIVFSTLKKILSIRVSSRDERRGLDYAEHYELGYPEFQKSAVNPGKPQ